MHGDKYLNKAVELVHNKWNMVPYPWTITLIAIKSILAGLHMNKEYSEQLPVWSQPLSSDDYSTLTEREQNILSSTEACRYADRSIRKIKFKQIYDGLTVIRKLAKLTDDTATMIAIGKEKKRPGIKKTIIERKFLKSRGNTEYDIRI